MVTYMLTMYTFIMKKKGFHSVGNPEVQILKFHQINFTLCEGSSNVTVYSHYAALQKHLDSVGPDFIR